MEAESLRQVEIKLEKESSHFETSYNELKEKETSKELQGIELRRAILDKYKQILIMSGELELPEEEKGKLTKELEELDQEYTVNGVHFNKCQIFRIIDALKNGQRVEIEGFGPYLRDYINYIDTEEPNLLETDELGLTAMEEFFKYLPELHAVSLADAYNTWANNYDTGTPRPLSGDEYALDKIDTEVAAPIKAKFKKWVEKVLRSRGLIRADETLDYEKGFVINEESELVDGAKQLAKLLAKKGLVDGDISKETGEIWFINKVKNADDCEDPRYTRIKLRSENGHWECAALDASQFLNERNLKITHLIILPREGFEEQQDRVWEILRRLEIGESKEKYQALNVHNIFIDKPSEKLTPEVVRTAIQTIFAPFN